MKDVELEDMVEEGLGTDEASSMKDDLSELPGLKEGSSGDHSE